MSEMKEGAGAIFRSRLMDQETVFGTFVTVGHPALCEILASAGFDFLVLDMEHGYMPDVMSGLIAGASQTGSPIIVRVPIGESPWINMVLDAGASGVLAPQVNDRKSAVRVGELSRYPPLGKRGLGPSRATDYGDNIGEHLENANEQLVVGVQIETVGALDELDEIAAVPGLDMLFLGPGDLSVSLGVPGQMYHRKIWEASSLILEAAERHSLAAGVFAPDATGARRFLKAGFNCVALGSDVGFLRRGIVDLSQFQAW